MSTPEVRCNLVVIRSGDLDRAETFYSALGLSFTRHSHGKGPVHLASEQQGIVFEICPVGKDGQGTTAARVGFAVPSVDDAFAASLAAGGAEVSAPQDSPCHSYSLGTSIGVRHIRNSSLSSFDSLSI
jgi:lactoylglutathione lyase